MGRPVPRKRGDPPRDGLARERRRDRPERRHDAPRMYCVAVINPMSCPRGLVALTYPLVNELCPRPHFSRKRCSLRIANALNVSSTDWQNVHRVIRRPRGRGRGAGNSDTYRVSGVVGGTGCLGEWAENQRLVHRFMRMRDAYFRPSPDRSLLPTFEKLFVGLREPVVPRSPGLSTTFPVFGENKPPFVSPGSRRAAGQRLFPRGSCTTFVVSVVYARALLRAHKHPTLSTVVATRVVVFHSFRSFTF